MVHPYGVGMDDLARLNMPTLIIVGEHDMVRASQTKEMAARIPHCRVEVFRDGAVSYTNLDVYKRQDTNRPRA